MCKCVLFVNSSPYLSFQNLQFSFASDAVEGIEMFVPVSVCTFSQSWSPWLTAFECILCTSVEFRSAVLHRGLGVDAEVRATRATVCICDYTVNMLGERRETVFLRSQCVATIEWHLRLRSVPRRSRGEGLMQVWGGGGGIFLSNYTVSFAAACWRFQLLLLPTASRDLQVQTYVLGWDDHAFVY